MAKVMMTTREEDNQEQVEYKRKVLFMEYKRANEWFTILDQDKWATDSAALGQRDAWGVITDAIEKEIYWMGFEIEYDASGKPTETRRLKWQK